MAVKRPTPEQLELLARELGFSLGAEDLQWFHTAMNSSLAAYDVLDDLPDFIPPVRYPRASGYRPSRSEDPYNAWYVKTEVAGAPDGKLVGRTIGLKDNICLAGVPMMNGSPTLEGYLPDLDATVVTRILDAGGTILGKTNCEQFCLSAGSHTNVTGPTYNPLRSAFTTGGSSSGSAAAIVAGDVDMALGGDQGGSIRVPAALCGIVGMKPTHGLVPYSGIMPVDPTLDHVGPMTRCVADNALLLDVIAGVDGLDPRQQLAMNESYVASLAAGVDGLRIGVVREGFGQRLSEPDVDAAVRAAAGAFTDLGAIVEEVSIPAHLLGPAIWMAIAAEGGTEVMMKGNAFGTGWRGLYVTSLRDAHAAWRMRADELHDTMKLIMLIGHYFSTRHRGHYYAKAQNLARWLRKQYDDALSRQDLLLMPTSLIKARAVPTPDAPREVGMIAAAGALSNTSPFNVSGHPAISFPCGMSDGLPVGMMLVSRAYGEATLYRAAAAFEATCDWRGQ